MYKKIRNKVLAMLMTIAMLFTVMPLMGITAVYDEVFAAAGLSYLNEKGETKYVDNYTELLDSTDTISDGWYVVRGEVKNSSLINVNGTAKILLTNGSSLSTELISVTSGNRLEVYAQSTETAEMGKLLCHVETGGGSIAAIGGSDLQDAGTIVINGGNISARAKAAAAIGGGKGKKSGRVTINGGVVEAESADPFSAVIGGAYEGEGGAVIISGGSVKVTGGGTGIGAGRQSADAVTVSISGGLVEAESYAQGYVAIGADQADGGNPGAAADVTISGGSVKALSLNKNAGIGIGSNKGGTIRIAGGTVEAKGKDAGIGAKDAAGASISIGWSQDTDSCYADSFKGNVSFDSGKRFIYRVEAGSIYTGSREAAAPIDEKSTIIPYVYTVHYEKGEQGIGGSMPDHGANPNYDVYLPSCSFTCSEDYVFHRWKIGDKEYAVNGRAKFEGNTTVTATWVRKGIPLTVSGIKAEDKTFDGRTDAKLDCSEAVLEGLAEGDPVTVSAKGSFADPLAGDDKKVNITEITLEGDEQGKYAIDTVNSQKETSGKIMKAKVILGGTGTPQSKVYDGNTKTEIKFGSGRQVYDTILKYNDVYFNSTAEGEFDSADAGTEKTVKLSKAELTGAHAANYEVDYSNQKLLKIEKAGITPKKVDLAAGENKRVYNGKPQFPEVTVAPEQLLGTDECEVVLDERDGVKDANCREYAGEERKPVDDNGDPAQAGLVRVKSLSNSNYRLKNTGETYPVFVCKKPITITTDDKSSRYGDPAENLTWAIEDRENSWFEPEDPEITCTVRDSRGAEIDPAAAPAGQYTIMPAWENENVNYITTFINGRYTVTDAPPPAPPAPAAKPVTVSGMPAAKMKAGRTSMTISWNRINGADGYDIFFAPCNKNNKYNTCKNISGNNTFKWTGYGLKKRTPYKAYVKAYIMNGSRKTYVSTSPAVHAYTGNGTKKYTNARSVTVRKKKVSLKKGKTYKIRARVKKVRKGRKLMPKSHAPALRYMTSDSRVAAVNAKGRITAKGRGTCSICVFAHNGVSGSIRVTVY